MKRNLRVLALCLCAVLMISVVACGKKAVDTAQDITNAPDPAIVGYWKDPISTNPSFSDVWCFNADGTYHLYQVASDGTIKGDIEGTYAISGDSITVVMAGHSLKYDTYKVTDEAITLTDHGSETVLSKYTGNIKK